MRRIILTSVLGLLFFLAPIGNLANAMQGGGCGCGGGGVTCQTNQKMAFSAAALLAGFYQINVVGPMAEGKSTGMKWLIHAVAYGVPAGLGYGGYQWWKSEALAKEAPKSKDQHKSL